MSKNKSILTSDKEHLQLFEDGIAINKDLPKWRRAEAGMEKTEKPNRVNEDIPSSPFNTYPSSVSGSHGTEDSSDVDSNIDVLPGWEGLYRTPYGINFDELAKAEIKNLTRDGNEGHQHIGDCVEDGGDAAHEQAYVVRIPDDPVLLPLVLHAPVVGLDEVDDGVLVLKTGGVQA